MNSMSRISGVVGVGCYADGAQAIGQCKNDGQFYCAKHGEGGYCAQCINHAEATTPSGVRSVVFILYGVAVLIVLVMIAGGMFYGSMFSSTSEFNQAGSASSGLIGGVIFGVVYFGVIGFPLLLMGRALNNGSGRVKGFILFIAYILLLLVPVGTIAGIVILNLLNQDPTQRWFEMRNIRTDIVNQATNHSFRDASGKTAIARPSKTDPNYVICSKCGLEQWSGYSECQKCGVQIAKLR